jgi:FkbM family methyltransferase
MTGSRLSRLNNAIGEAVGGRRRLQPFWVRLHHLALLGLNAGRGALIESSGERWVIDVLLPALGDEGNLVVADVGGHDGEFTSAVLTSVPAARVFCFEPQPDSAARLRSLFADRAQVDVLDVGLSDEAGERRMFIDHVSSALGSVYDRRLQHLGVVMQEGPLCRFETIDRLRADGRLGNIDFLKLDVEGHELAVLRGGAMAIRDQAVDVIQFEFGGTNIDSGTYLQSFWHLLCPEYRLFRILTDGLWELKTYDERDEIFVTTNFLAVRAGSKVLGARPDLFR